MTVRASKTAVYRGFKYPRPLNQYARCLTVSAKNDWSERTTKIYDDEGRSMIPLRVRRMLDLSPGDEVKFINADGVVVLKKVEDE